LRNCNCKNETPQGCCSPGIHRCLTSKCPGTLASMSSPISRPGPSQPCSTYGLPSPPTLTSSWSQTPGSMGSLFPPPTTQCTSPGLPLEPRSETERDSPAVSMPCYATSMITVQRPARAVGTNEPCLALALLSLIAMPRGVRSAWQLAPLRSFIHPPIHPSSHPSLPLPGAGGCGSCSVACLVAILSTFNKHLHPLR